MKRKLKPLERSLETASGWNLTRAFLEKDAAAFDAVGKKRIIPKIEPIRSPRSLGNSILCFHQYVIMIEDHRVTNGKRNTVHACN